MAILGVGCYRCEACKNFDADGIDGNSPSCLHGFKATRVDEECAMFELGTPCGYAATYEDRAKRAQEIAEMLGEQDCDKGAKELRHSDEATMPRLENDTVAFPAHYTQGGIECIDAMESALTPDEFRGYLRGNVIKYVWRYDRKGAPVEDLRKAAWYLDRLTREVGRDDG